MHLILKVLIVSLMTMLTNSVALANDDIVVTEVKDFGSQTADIYGVFATRAIYLNEKNNFDEINYDGIPRSTYTMNDSGYMAQGMSVLIPNNTIADANIAKLFNKYSNLKDDSNIVLPSEFDNLIAFMRGYIRTTALKNAETRNGLTHLKLATEIARASLCFGTDPFMLLAKILRETSFDRTGVSSGSAVGFSQMTGAGIEEVQHQMSGNSEISVAKAKAEFQKAINCFSGYHNFDVPTGGRVAVQSELLKFYRLDLTFGQILTKTYVTYSKALGSGTVFNSYKEAFALYNGDTRPVTGVCLGLKTKVELKYEYACDIMSYFSRLSKVWNDFLIELNRNKDA